MSSQSLKPCVDGVTVEDAFYVVDYAVRGVGEEAAHVELFELVVGHSEDNGIVS